MSEELTKITLEQLGKEYARVIDERGILEKKLDIAIDFLDRLSHWDMLWLGTGQPSLVADGPYWKKEIDETLKKLRE